MRRIFPFLASILLGLFLAAAGASSRPDSILLGRAAWSALLGVGTAYAQTAPLPATPNDGGVFLYQDRNGRKVYTNLEGVAAHGKAGLVKLDLPPLSSIDFEHTGPEGLRTLDQRVTESHNA